MDYVEGTKITAVSHVEWTEVDGVTLGDDLFRAYLQQILVDGVFHADPHPGNVLLTPDHRLALIDLGMVGRLSSAMQERLFRLLLAISDGGATRRRPIVIAIGEKLEDFDEMQVRRIVIDLVGRYQTRRRAGAERRARHAARWPEPSTRHGLRMPSGAGAARQDAAEPRRDRPPARSGLRRQRVDAPERHAADAAADAEQRDAGEAVLDGAGGARFRRAAARPHESDSRRAGSANDLRLKIEVIDHGSIIDGFQKVANRIALGLVLAALIVGAAMLMRVQTPFTILGYPGLAMLLFLAAAGGGFWMAWTILAGDVKTGRTDKS